MAASSDEFVRVATKAELAAASGSLRVTLNGKGVAIFDSFGALHAVQNACPHRGAPLIGGHVRLMIDGLYVICPDHAWRFDLTNGACPEAGPECTLLTWDVKVEGEDILLSKLPRMGT